MEYRRFGNKLVVRLERGEEVCAKLLELAERENIRTAAVSGIGASNDVTLGVFDTGTKEYFKKRYNGIDYELGSLTGTLSRQDGAPSSAAPRTNSATRDTLTPPSSAPPASWS